MPASAILAASVVAAWVFVALAAGQSLSAEQSSTLLMSYGAVDGTVFDTHQWWRLITSQWLHAKWQHMLLNVVGISLAGSYLECAQGWRATLGLYLAGGALAALASVWAYPNLETSGASQALLALYGAAVLLPLSERKIGLVWWVLLALIAIQLWLDLSVVRTIKVGHAVGASIGLAWGAIFYAQHRLHSETQP